MAITKLLRLKESGRGNKAQHLKNNLKYILNPEKTQGGLNIGGNAGVTWHWIYESMIDNKRYWHKEDGTQGFHYMISFPPELDVSIETAHAVAQAFCDRLLGENYLYVYAIHDDKPHLHIHVTFDSVSRTTGMKFHSPAGDWEKRIQPITDEVCRKFGLPALEFEDDVTGKTYKSWQDDKATESGGRNRNQVSWNDIIRDDIDEGIQKTATYEDFLAWLRSQHYAVRDGKYLSLKPYGKPKAVRTKSLGSGYGKEEIIERIGLEKERPSSYKVYGDQAAIRLLFIKRRYGNPGFHLTPFQRQFYRRWKNTCFIRKPGFKDSWKYKKDVLSLQQMSDQLQYLLDHGIGTPEGVAERKADLETERKAAGSAFNAAKASFYMDTTCRLVRSRRKLLGKQETGEDVAEELRCVESEILEQMTLMEAEERFAKRREIYDESRIRVKELKKEIRLVNTILEDMKAWQLPEGLNREKERSRGLELNRAKGVKHRVGEEIPGGQEKEL